jgi:acetolactate synthase-1/2/3 large subunit
MAVPCALIASAKQPLIIAGLDLVGDAGASSLWALAERLGAPVLTSYKAKGLPPECHPLCIGESGLSPKADAIVKPLIATAASSSSPAMTQSRCGKAGCGHGGQTRP